MSVTPNYELDITALVADRNDAWAKNRANPSPEEEARYWAAHKAMAELMATEFRARAGHG